MSEYDPALYAATHVGKPGDVEHYLALSEGGLSVLELGVGAGRIAGPLAAAGYAVVGLEIDRGMLSEARRRLEGASVELVHADMRDFSLGRRFDRIYLPYNGIFCLLDEASLIDCLRSIAAHLEPDGVFGFDAYVADGFHHEMDELDYPNEPELAAEIVHEGRQLSVFESSRWDRERQRFAVRYRYEDADRGLVHEASIEHRYWLSDELPTHLARAGLSLLSLRGGFEDEAFDPAGDLMVGVVRRSGR